MRHYKIKWSINCHRRKRSRICLYFLVVTVIGVFLAFDTREDRRRLISAAGILLWVLLLALFSKHPRKIDWRQVKSSSSTSYIQISSMIGQTGGHFFLQVTWGLTLQFIFALLILRWSWGQAFFNCLGHKIDRFLAFTNEGSGFVFGYLVHQNLFNTQALDNQSLAFNVSQDINQAKAVPSVVVFSSLSVIYFFSFVVNILFYLGVIQWVTAKIGWVLNNTIGTSTVESMNAACNIFIGQAMAPLLIKVRR